MIWLAIAITAAIAGSLGFLTAALFNGVSYRRGRQDTVREAAALLRHIDTLDKVGGAKLGFPNYNPLWDAGCLLEQELLPEGQRSWEQRQ